MNIAQQHISVYGGGGTRTGELTYHYLIKAIEIFFRFSLKKSIPVSSAVLAFVLSYSYIACLTSVHHCLHISWDVMLI